MANLLLDRGADLEIKSTAGESVPVRALQTTSVGSLNILFTSVSRKD
jgi:hypothetical protein